MSAPCWRTAGWQGRRRVVQRGLAVAGHGTPSASLPTSHLLSTQEGYWGTSGRAPALVRHPIGGDVAVATLELGAIGLGGHRVEVCRVKCALYEGPTLCSSVSSYDPTHAGPASWLGRSPVELHRERAANATHDVRPALPHLPCGNAAWLMVGVGRRFDGGEVRGLIRLTAYSAIPRHQCRRCACAITPAPCTANIKGR